jgi:hypothetical protein
MPKTNHREMACSVLRYAFSVPKAVRLCRSFNAVRSTPNALSVAGFDKMEESNG